MKKRVAIFFLFIMLFQAMPVHHFFMGEQQVVCATGEEESSLTCKEVKGHLWDESCFLSNDIHSLSLLFSTTRFFNHSAILPPSPYAERLAPPPDHC